jgi:tRNA (adenine37-N6)-methyltransferase
MQITLEPIAYFRSEMKEKADAPRQGSLASSSRGVLQFVSGKNFEQALQDLEGMERIWVLFWMDKACHWKPKVQPPRAVRKKGVFSTRSPHRPNPIGLSCVKLISVFGLAVTVEEHDLLDGSPILDIKPYLPYADSFSNVSLGWMQDLAPLVANKISWSELALKELALIDAKKTMQQQVEKRLSFFIGESASNRALFLNAKYYLQAYKEWRFILEKTKEDELHVLAILSGYRKKERADFAVHQALYREFSGDIKALLLEISIFSKLQGKVCLEF